MISPWTPAPATVAAMPNWHTPGRATYIRPTSEEATSRMAASAGLDSLDGHGGSDAQYGIAVEGQTSPQANHAAATMQFPPAGTKTTAAASAMPTPRRAAPLPFTASQGHSTTDLQSVRALAADIPGGRGSGDTQVTPAAGEHDQPTATEDPTPSRKARSADTIPHTAIADATPTGVSPRVGQTPPPAITRPTPNDHTPGADGDPAPAIAESDAKVPTPGLVSPLLGVAAEIVDDLEKVRIANENRLRQLTRGGPDDERIKQGKVASVADLPPDKDGDERGFAYPESEVKVLAELVDLQHDLEKKAIRALEKMLRSSPLGPWVEAQRGLGLKQTARLLAAIGDPYVRPEMVREDGIVEPSRPRTVSELWAYTGFHVINVPADQQGADTHGAGVGGDDNGSGPGQTGSDSQRFRAGAAPKRERGKRSNWNETARKRTWLIATSVIKAGGDYRDVYDVTRSKYEGAVHKVPCVRCGPSGKPAPIGSPLSRGHLHARGLRAIAKTVLKDLWREAKRLHEHPAGGRSGLDAQGFHAAGRDTEGAIS